MLLIRNGLIHTMTAAGSFRGDILAKEGKIIEIGVDIDCQPDEIIDAEGWQICPGLIDAHIHLVNASDDERKNIRDICADALSSGVTTQALWPENGGQCLVRHGIDGTGTLREPMRSVIPEKLGDNALAAVMRDAASCGERIACEVYSEKQLRRLLEISRDTGCKLVLAHLVGCDAYADEIVASGCEVIMGACVLRCGSSSYAFAARLMRAGVCVALTSDYPATRLHHLPLSAGLCVRGGMDHHDALAAITRNAARLLRVDDVCGTIEPGKRADFTIFDGDPLLLATARVMTVSSGRVMEKS